MSVQATTWVYEHSQAKGADRLVLLVIADAANKEGLNSCQSAATLAKMAAVSERTVWRCIARLESIGEIVKSDFHAGYKANVYSLPGVTSGQGVRMSYPDNDDTETMTSVQPTMTSVQKTYDTDGTQPKYLTQLTPELTPKTPDADAPAQEHPAKTIATKCYEATNGALPFMGILAIAKWAIDKNNSSPKSTENAIAELWRRGRPVTKQTVAHVLNGTTTSGKPTVSDKMRDTISRGQALQDRLNSNPTDQLQIGAPE